MENGNQGLTTKASRARTIAIALALVAATIMVLSVFAAVGVSGAQVHPETGTAVTASSTPWTYPTTTEEEPNYTGGTYITAATTDVEYLNVYKASDLYSFMLLDELYDSAVAFGPNQTTYFPWAASSYVESTAPAGTTTFDPVTGTTEPVAYYWNVTLRPGIQWSDWNTSNSADTYVYSNVQTYNYYDTTTKTVTSTTETFPWAPVTMNTETMQSADLILSWEIMETSSDYSPSYANIVNVVPLTNLTAEFELSAQSATFVDTTLATPILPYHVWVKHDWASVTTDAWNYTGQPNGYDVWGVGLTSSGTSTQLIGSGPYMFNGGYGQPAGQWVVGDYWKLYVNPHYFAQYVPSLEQFSPKLAELYTPLYLSESDAVTALLLGQADTVENGVDPTYIPTIDTDSNAFIFYQPGSAIGFAQLDPWSPGQTLPGPLGSTFAPATTSTAFNLTVFRQALNYATDKAYLCSVVDEGYCQIGQPIIPASDSLWHNFTAPQYSYDPSLAESMIKGITGMTQDSAGDWVYNGVPVTANMQITVASEDPLGVEGALIIAQEWSAIGVPTTITQEAFSTLVANFLDVGYSSANLGITGISGDPTGFFLETYVPTIGLGTGFYEGPFSAITLLNGTSLTGPQVTGLLANLTNELNSITNLGQRLDLALEIEGIAAQESTMINLNYPTLILPFTNNTFGGLEENSLPYSTYMYFNYLSLYLKSSTSQAPPSTIPTELKVGVVAETGNVFSNGQFGNITVSVRDQYGAPVGGMNVTVGTNPSGALLNISSDLGVTNSAGTYTWEFQVLPTNPLIYTLDYSGEINISVAVTPPASLAKSVVPGLGWTYIDVSPAPVAFYATNDTALVDGVGPQAFNILVYNPVTGAPISGYQYEVQALAAAVNLTKTSSAQAYANASSYNPIYGFGFASVPISTNSTGVTYFSYNLTSVTGVTGSNGLITVDVGANGSANWALAAANLSSTWLFIGNYEAGAPLGGSAPYQLISEMTAAYDPGGFGVQQPVEVPLTVAEVAPTVTLAVSVSSDAITPGGTSTVTVTATNSLSGVPVPDYAVTVYAQNALGANRGLLSSPVGFPVEVFNPNGYFGSTFFPGLDLTTNATGVATATFSPGLYTPGYSDGVFTGFSPQPYADPYLIPFDEFELGAIGVDASPAAGQITSSQLSTPATTFNVAAAYIAGSSSTQGVTLLTGGENYTVYVNTTLNSIAGPAVGAVNVSIATTLGTLTPTSGATSTSGSFSSAYAVPDVTVLTAVQLAITYNTGTGNATTYQTVYVEPAVSKTPTKTTSTDLTLYYALIGLFVVLTVIFAALWASARRPRPPSVTTTSPPMDQSSTSGMPPTSSGGPGSSGPPGGS